MALATPVASFMTPMSNRFGATKHFAPTNNAVLVPPLHLKRFGLGDLSTKEFQLEELEDKEECETELWLNNDGTVTLGLTNGPQYSGCNGDWHIIETASEDEQPFRMRLTRSYEVAKGGASYDVTREFWGSIEMVGASISVSGKIHGGIGANEQFPIDSELGYFTMIDAEASEADVEKAASAHPSGAGITSYLSDLGNTNSQLSGSGMPSYLDAVGGVAPAASVAKTTPGVAGSPSSTVDTKVTRDGRQTTVTVTSVTTVVI
ncbi:hypothetical protein ACHAXR_012120 [Thalassiosira sp. AJA248-18]